MNTIRRTVIASALAIPLSFGAAGVAFADTGYGESANSAGPSGATSQSTVSWTHEGHHNSGHLLGHHWGHHHYLGHDYDNDGDSAGYLQHSASATPDGAATANVASLSGHGATLYYQDAASATADGASNSVQGSFSN